MPIETNRRAGADRALGAFFGLAVGDALGTPLEFSRRDSLPEVVGMRGGGPFSLRPGEWTDDTSMALALADSLCARKGLDGTDAMERWSRWRRFGEYSHNGRCFDIGGQTSSALAWFEREGTADLRRTERAGNGGIMRLAPAAIFAFGCGLSAEEAGILARRQSDLTHPNDECSAAAEAMGILLLRLMRGEATAADAADGTLRERGRASIRSTGYVVDTLEAARWAVGRTESFRDAVLLAVNLGDDADTVGAVAGQLAGAAYGASGIPREWLDALAWRERIVDWTRRLLVGTQAGTIS